MSGTPAAPNWRQIFFIAALVGLFAGAVGGTPVLMGVLLKERQLSSAFIGLSASSTPAGLIAGALLVPYAVRRVGAYAVALGCALGGAVLLVSMAAWMDPWFWLVARFGWGMAIGAYYVINKAWLAQVTPAAHRGRVAGLYGAVLAAGFSCGPLLLAALDFSAWGGLSALALMLLGAAAVLVAGRRGVPAFQGKEKASALSFLPYAPVLVLCAALFGAFDHVTLGFLPAYGARQGISLREMGVALAVLNIGNVLLQAPIGWLADRFDRGRVLAGCAVATATGAGLLPLAMRAEYLLLPFLFVWGALAYAVVTIAVAVLGDRFQGATLLAGSAALTMAGGLGGVIGPPLVGAGMDWMGDAFLPLALGAAFCALALLVIVYGPVRATPVSSTPEPLQRSTHVPR